MGGKGTLQHAGVTPIGQCAFSLPLCRIQSEYESVVSQAIGPHVLALKVSGAFANGIQNDCHHTGINGIIAMWDL